jgi:hypothetical protein
MAFKKELKTRIEMFPREVNDPVVFRWKYKEKALSRRAGSLIC